MPMHRALALAAAILVPLGAAVPGVHADLMTESLCESDVENVVRRSLPADTCVGAFAAARVSTNGGKTCVLTTGRDVDCFGPTWSHADYSGGDAVDVSVGSIACVVTSAGWVECDNYFSDAGDARTAYDGGLPVAVSIGLLHGCLLLETGNVDCFGRNEYGEGEDRGGGDAVAVSVGWFHSCALLVNASVDCWGHPIAKDRWTGDAAGVSAGAGHVCVLLTNGNVDCHGANNFGQSEDYLGGDAVQVAAAGYHTCMLKASGDAECWGHYVTTYEGGDLAVSIASGHRSLCVLFATGSVDCMGPNNGPYEDYVGVAPRLA